MRALGGKGAVNPQGSLVWLGNEELPIRYSNTPTAIRKKEGTTDRKKKRGGT